MTDFIVDCERFDELLSDLLEGTLAPRDQRAAELHQAGCLRCAALVRDLDDIRAGAAALPPLRPSRDLWSGIAERIEAPVMPLAPRAEPARRRPFGWRTAAVAAALVLVTAGVTHQLTLRSMGDARGDAVATTARAATPAVPDETHPADQPAPSTEGAVAIDALVPLRPPPTEPQRSSSRPEPRLASGARTGGTAAVPASARAAGSEAASVYDREAELLRKVLEERRGALDPATVAILESNLTVIDRAIAESREALRRDPASRLLLRQLDLALESRIRLLRTAAMLPARS